MLRIIALAALIAIPNGMSNIFDVLGWRKLLPKNVRGFFRLFTIHFSAEVIVRSLPGGVPIGDSVKAILLKKEFDVPSSSSFASVIWRRWFLGFTQSLYIFLGAALGFSYVYACSVKMTGNGDIAWSALASGGILACILLSVFFIPAMKIGKVLLSLLLLIPFKKMRQWFAKKEEVFLELDKIILDIKNRSAREIAQTAALYFVVWMWETIETYIYLLALGYHAAFLQAFAIETIVSAMRLIMFFLPSGAGVQELGYAGLMVAFGLVGSPKDAASFLLLKRARDIAGISIGYAILVKKGIKPSRKLVPEEIPES